MSTRLVILGLLRARQMYGYELKHTIERHMGDWTSIAFGSIYFALGKMAREGLVEKLREEREGGRPARSIYRITDAGREEFLRLLRTVWQEPERLYFTVDIGLFFADALPPSEVSVYLRRRIDEAEQVLEHLRRHEQEQLLRPEVPARARAIFEHTRLHMEAEREWLRRLRDEWISASDGPLEPGGDE